MPRTPCILGALFLALLLPACAHCPRAADTTAFPSDRAESPDAAELREQIAAANRRLEDLFTRGDLAGVAAMYTDDAVMLSPGGSRTGRAAIDDSWARYHQPVSWRLDVHTIDGSLERGVAHQTGTSTLRYHRPDGAPHTSIVDFALIWRRADDGQWRIAIDAYWPPPPPGPGPKRD